MCVRVECIRARAQRGSRARRSTEPSSPSRQPSAVRYATGQGHGRGSVAVHRRRHARRPGGPGPPAAPSHFCFYIVSHSRVHYRKRGKIHLFNASIVLHVISFITPIADWIVVSPFNTFNFKVTPRGHLTSCAARGAQRSSRARSAVGGRHPPLGRRAGFQTLAASRDDRRAQTSRRCRLPNAPRRGRRCG